MGHNTDAAPQTLVDPTLAAAGLDAQAPVPELAAGPTPLSLEADQTAATAETAEGSRFMRIVRETGHTAIDGAVRAAKATKDLAVRAIKATPDLLVDLDDAGILRELGGRAQSMPAGRSRTVARVAVTAARGTAGLRRAHVAARANRATV
jgi:hypothetical protein